jgi:hypothetical protein
MNHTFVIVVAPESVTGRNRGGYGITPVMEPADTFTTANGEPMIVGPITLLICPI